MPSGDLYNLPTSEKRFEDGGQYRFEVPGIQGPKVMQALLEAMDSYGLHLHRVTQTQGIMRLTDEEIAGMVDLAHKYETDLILAIGPRATTDTSASVHTEEGVRMGYRLRGQEQIVRAIEDVKPLVWYAFIAYILVSIPVSYLFAFVLKMGPQGVWWGFPFGLTTAGLLFFQRFYRKTKTEK